MHGQKATRNGDDPADMLSAFDREERDASFEKPDKNDPPVDQERKAPVIDFDGRDSLPRVESLPLRVESLPLRGPSDSSFVRYEPAPDDRKKLMWAILGIAVVVLASVGV